MEKLRVQRALKHAIPRDADESFEPGDKVLVWREKIVDHRIGECIGPFTVVCFEPERKIVHVQDNSNS